MMLAWGARVSPAFRVKAMKIADRLGCSPDELMACMAFETGETFSPSVRNRQSGATGLIQFMPSTATMLGTTTSALAGMTAEEQLDYVDRYFAGYTGKLRTLEDLYMAILWPRAVGKPNDYVLFREPSAPYRQNAGLDANRDGIVTKAEAAAPVRAKLAKGRSPELAAPLDVTAVRKWCYVTANTLNRRSAPTSDAPRVGFYRKGTIVNAQGIAHGERVGLDSRWLLDVHGTWVWAGGTDYH